MELIGQGRTADVFTYGDDKVIKVFHHKFSYLAEIEYFRVIEVVNAGVITPKA